MNRRLGSANMFGPLHMQFSSVQTLKIAFLDFLIPYPSLSTWFLSVIFVVDWDMCSTFPKRRDGEIFPGIS